MERLVEAGVRLMRGQRSYHPELAHFRSFNDYVEVADLDPALKALKRLLLTYGERATEMMRTIRKRSRKEAAEITVSTVHKAKGLEWDHVLLGDDYPALEDAPPEEWNLRYVAVTRARQVLDVRYWE